MQLTPLNRIFRHFFPRVKGAAMVIPEARARLHKALGDLLAGRITNMEFDIVYSEMQSSEDRGVAEVARFGWGLYSDSMTYRLTEHYLIKPQMREIAERCLLFLKTELEYGWPDSPSQLWQGMAWSLAFNALLPLGVALIIVALALLASALGNGSDFNYFLICGVLGCILLFSCIGLWRWPNRRDSPSWQTFWASGDREVWPFLNRDQYGEAVPKLSTPAVPISSWARGGPDRNPSHPI